MGLNISALSSEVRKENPLPFGESRTIARAVQDSGTIFTVQEGLDERLIQQLREFSLDATDTELQKTSDYQRFGTGSYRDWYASKERTVFALVETSGGALAALAWFGPKPFGRKSLKHLSAEECTQDERALDSSGWHTIVYRSYPPFRGTGLMKDFVRFALSEYEHRHPGAKIWAGIYSDNPASIGLATKLGFKISETAGGNEETIMVKE